MSDKMQHSIVIEKWPAVLLRDVANAGIVMLKNF